MLTLSKRLGVIAEMIPYGDNVCDVGTDHGYLPLFLASSGKYGNITATDIREKPLENAKSNLEKSGVTSVRLLLCDGLEKVERSDADTVIIAGMGGEVIGGIMDRTPFLKDDVTLILQPMTAAVYLREYLCRNGFEILSEIPLEENGKLYSVIKAHYTGNAYECDGVFALIGKIDVNSEYGRKYAEKQLKVCCDVINSLSVSPETQEKCKKFIEIKQTLTKLLEE